MQTDHAPKYLGLETYLRQMGEVGIRLTEMHACEGAAGNMSIGLAWEVGPLPVFPEAQPFELADDYPALSGKSFLVTGSGCRLRDIARGPAKNLGLVQVAQDGHSARLFTEPGCYFSRLTSEFRSHLVVHWRAFADPARRFNAVLHAQPVHLTYLTNIRRYQDGKRLCEAVLRWQPELTIVFPLGFGYVPFGVPNSDELVQMTREVDPAHQLLVWEKHGVVAVSDQDIYKACDLIEYAETGARYEYLNLVNGEAGEGLLPSQIQAIRRHFKLPDPADGASS